ncbi:16S rRNA (adenine(1518)-N(6)/adenine(1519)-N(6))-dimethyltransferase RsmA [Caldiplasma sukawensis]
MKQYTKKYGQVFLKDKNIIKIIVDILIRENIREIIEIGPGTGNVTSSLLASSINVKAIESDHRFVSILSEKFNNQVNSKQLQIIHMNFLDYVLHNEYVFGNIPYHITSEIVEKIAYSGSPFALLMMQKELGERIYSDGGKTSISRLGVMCNLVFDIKIEKVVSKNSFEPRPKVESALVSFRRKNDSRINQGMSEKLREMFSQRRKKMGTYLDWIPKQFRDMRVEELNIQQIGEILNS